MKENQNRLLNRVVSESIDLLNQIQNHFLSSNQRFKRKSTYFVIFVIGHVLAKMTIMVTNKTIPKKICEIFTETFQPNNTINDY